MKRIWTVFAVFLLLCCIPASFGQSKKKGEPTTRSVQGVVANTDDSPVTGFLALVTLSSCALIPTTTVLFNGQDLDGWAVADAGDQPAYAVENGAIRTRPGGGLLWYAGRKIGNATLRVVYQMSAPDGNS